MAVVSMKQLLESGVHFGHATKRWNPKMAPYIYTSRNGIHIIDLKLAQAKIEEAYNAVLEVVKAGGEVLFVGTKKQAQNAIKDAAEKTGQYYVDHRWLGGTLTNFNTIRRRIKRLHDLYKMEEDGTFDLLPKKEVLNLVRERNKLDRNLGGIQNMKKLPGILFIVDPIKEVNAILEARKLNIPIVGIVDTNCDPDLIDYVIPGNDDAIRAVTLISNVIANAVIEANGGYVEKYDEEDDQEQGPKRDYKPRAKKEFTPRTNNKNNNREDRREYKPRVAREEKSETPKVEKVAPKTVAPKQEVKAEVKKVAEVKKETKAVSVDYSKLTVAQLKDIARDNELVGYSTLRKAELIELITTNVK